MKDNEFRLGNVVPVPALTGTGNEARALAIPDNSSLKNTRGDDQAEPYVKQRLLVGAALTRALEVRPPRARRWSARSNAGSSEPASPAMYVLSGAATRSLV